MSNSPYMQILDRAIGDIILTTIGKIEPKKEDVDLFIKSHAITLENVAEHYVNQQIQTGQIPFPVSLYRTSLIAAVDTQLRTLPQEAGVITDTVFEFVTAWAKDEATKLGA
jgi:hypothetical protein